MSLGGRPKIAAEESGGIIVASGPRGTRIVQGHARVQAAIDAGIEFYALDQTTGKIVRFGR